MKKLDIHGINFELPEKYDPIKLIGKGTYGAVCSAVNKETNQKVAIKKLAKIEDLIDAKRVLREILIMKNLQHENILGLIDCIYVPVDGEFGDLYLVSELMETDLNRVIKSKQQLKIEHMQYFLYQVLRAFKFIHSAELIHRDLKPSNILLNENCDLKICDFGLSRNLSREKKEDLTEYVVTRFYRAPEIMLSSHEYSKAVDIWSAGCSFAEILSSKVLFPGQNYIEQINMIINVRGTPDAETKALISNEHALKYIEEIPAKEPADLSEMFPNTPEEALDLLEKMLNMNHLKRITVDEAL